MPHDHFLNRHNREIIICDQSGAANNTKKALRVHKISDHLEDKGKKLTCSYIECKEKFRVPFQVRYHVKRVHKKTEETQFSTVEKSTRKIPPDFTALLVHAR